MTWAKDDPRWPVVWDMMRRDIHHRIHREWCAKSLSRQFGGCHTTWLKCLHDRPKTSLPHRQALLARVWLSYAHEHDMAARRLKFEALMYKHGLGDGPVRRAREKLRSIRAHIGRINGGDNGHEP